MTKLAVLRCHFCQEARPDLAQSPRDPAMWWCPPGDVECNFRARRRLGLPLVVALEAKARELEGQATQTRHRVAAILASEPPERTVEYLIHLASNSWVTFRDEQRLLAGHRCECCGRVDSELHVHHLTYDRLGHERPADVVVLCRICHLRWDEARRVFYRREKSFQADAGANAIYADLLTAEVQARIRERCAGPDYRRPKTAPAAAGRSTA
jgi:5-methylcytosine-specific restriction endonuclease McrA